jgi:phage tail-like protein
MSDLLLSPFRFRLEFKDSAGGEAVPLCRAAFSEVSGLEATMEPKAIREGGWNRGERQRAGRVTFSTVVLKRGVTPSQHLFRWFDLVASGAYAVRLDAHLVHLGPGEDAESGPGALAWRLSRALPVRFKAATLTAATGGEVAVEELHLVHEGLSLVRSGGGGG